MFQFQTQKLQKANDEICGGIGVQHEELETWKTTCDRLTASVTRKETELQNLSDKCHDLENQVIPLEVWKGFLFFFENHFSQVIYFVHVYSINRSLCMLPALVFLLTNETGISDQCKSWLDSFLAFFFFYGGGDGATGSVF